mmetsp:Transcript_5141/g.9030  ORF Transcript_5141/g.9030 Transcript_5141/m.9030 type:complete len:200 (+) Transcript_5141:655-1254(+)
MTTVCFDDATCITDSAIIISPVILGLRFHKEQVTGLIDSRKNVFKVYHSGIPVAGRILQECVSSVIGTGFCLCRGRWVRRILRFQQFVLFHCLIALTEGHEQFGLLVPVFRFGGVDFECLGQILQGFAHSFHATVNPIQPVIIQGVLRLCLHRTLIVQSCFIKLALRHGHLTHGPQLSRRQNFPIGTLYRPTMRRQTQN